jgi:single-strand DNA-binding protein
MKTLNNQVQLIGNLGQDPELKTFDSGNQLCRFSLATTDYYKDKDGNRQEKTEWHNVVAWGRLGEVMAEILNKGERVVIHGKLKSRTYENAEGQTKYITEILTSDFLKISRKKEEAA